MFDATGAASAIDPTDGLWRHHRNGSGPSLDEREAARALREPDEEA